jgi:hypothetical protein
MMPFIIVGQGGGGGGGGGGAEGERSLLICSYSMIL